MDPELVSVKAEVIGGRLRGRLAANVVPRGIPEETPWRFSTSSVRTTTLGRGRHGLEGELDEVVVPGVDLSQ